MGDHGSNYYVDGLVQERRNSIAKGTGITSFLH